MATSGVNPLDESRTSVSTFTTAIEESQQPIHNTLNHASRDLELRLFGYDPDELLWRERALCRGMGESIFFPERGYSMLGAYVICHSCPVRVECLESALTNGDNHGVRAGFTPYEREKIHADLANGMSLKDAMAPRDSAREGKLRKARAKQQAQAQAFLARDVD